MTDGDATIALVRDGGYTAYADSTRLGEVTDVGTFHFNNSYTALGGAMTGRQNFIGPVHGLWLLNRVLPPGELATFGERSRQ